MRIHILAAARDDLKEGSLFYDSLENGLGEYFLSSVSADIERLRISAGIHPMVYKDFHRALCRTFPFAIYYKKTEKRVTIYAVVDCRRDPHWIENHLRESRELERPPESDPLTGG